MTQKATSNLAVYLISDYVVVSIAVYNVPLVPESCCEQSGGETRNLDLCQKSQQGPPAKVAGNLNAYLHYRVGISITIYAPLHCYYFSFCINFVNLVHNTVVFYQFIIMLVLHLIIM